MTFHKTGGNMSGAGSISGRKEEITLNDYIARKSDPFIMPDGTNISGLHKTVVDAVKPKLTFEEWYMNKLADGDNTGFYRLNRPLLKYVWNTAQENK